MRLAAFLIHQGSVVTDAHVTVKVTSPLTSLSSLSTPLIRHRALAADTVHIPPSLQILTKTMTTQYEAKLQGREFIPELPTPQVDGVYHVEVNATGNACGGVFERYWSGSLYVGLPGRPRPNLG